VSALRVLNVSLDAQIAWGAAGRPVLGDPAKRQRLYAARLGALHVVVKTGRDVPPGRLALAPNAWAYPTHSRTRYTFVADAFRIGAALCRRETIDVISAQDPFATGLVCWLLARRFGTPLNLQVHFDVLDNPYWLREKREHRALNAFGRWLVRRADTVRVGTTREAERFAQRGIARDRVFVAPVPVDVGRFAAAEASATASATATATATAAAPDPGILNASRLVPQKDLPTLLRACREVFARVPDASLAIAGDGPEHQRLQALASELGIASRVRFLGRVDHDDMPALVASSSVLAVSSVYEGTSLVTVQAAAAGKPVVTTDVAGATDTVIDGETGYVVPIGDHAALAERLVEVLRNPECAAEMGRAGRAHVLERYDLERCVGQVVEMWEQTAKGDLTATNLRSHRIDTPVMLSGANHPLPPARDHGSFAALRMTSRRVRTQTDWLYLANVRVPSEKAHVYQIFQMLDAFAEVGVDVTLAYPRRANIDQVRHADPVALYGLRHAPRLCEVPAIDPVKLVTIDAPRLNRAPFPQMAFGVQSATFAFSAAALVRRVGPAVVYSRDWPVLAAALAAGARCVWEAHDAPQQALARRALPRLLPRLAGIVAITHGLQRELVALGAPPGRTMVAADAVDLQRFSADVQPGEARSALALVPDRRYVVYTGHLYRWKGAHTLALASRLLPSDTDVLIVGGTPADLTSFTEFVARERLDRVRVVGHVPPTDVPMWLAAANVLALPNSAVEAISARYTSPLKLYEYMAARRPIVASDLPSLREALRHGESAWLVRPDEPEALAEGLRAVLTDPALAKRLAARARQDVEGHTWAARARAIKAFVERVAPAHGALA
jgi:glycosyltransferase involved in cell wall biosynthesis